MNGLATYASVLLTVVVVMLAYARLLGYPMSAGDTSPLLSAVVVEGPGDLWRLLSRPLLSETGFTAGFYRPVALLSLALDRYLWGASPSGYYATNIALHALGAVLVFAVGRQLLGHSAPAALAAVLFAAHPLAVEVVPSIARRQDLLAGVLGLASLAAFFRWRGGGSGAWLSAGCLSFALALGSKEIAVYVPVLIAVGALIAPDRRSRRPALLPLAAYGATAALYLTVRTLVLSDVGGYGAEPALWRMRYTVTLYFSELFVPQVLQSLSVVGIGGTGLGLILATLLFVAVAAAYQARARVSAAGAFPLLAIWTLCPLLVLLATSTVAHRSFYSGIAPACLLIANAVALVTPFSGSTGRDGRRVLFERLAIILSAAMAASVLLHSPAIRPYPHWRVAGTAFDELRTEIARVVRSTDMDEVRSLHLLNAPSYREAFGSRTPSAKTVSYYRDYVIASWLSEIGYPGLTVEVSFQEVSPGIRPVVTETVRDGSTLGMRFATGE